MAGKWPQSDENAVKNGNVASNDRGHDKGEGCSQNLSLDKGKLSGWSVSWEGARQCKKKKTLMAAAAMEASLQKSPSDDQHGNTSTGGGSCCEVVTVVSVQWLGSRHWSAKVEVAVGLKMVQNCERKLLENGEARD